MIFFIGPADQYNTLKPRFQSESTLVHNPRQVAGLRPKAGDRVIAGRGADRRLVGLFTQRGFTVTESSPSSDL